MNLLPYLEMMICVGKETFKIFYLYFAFIFWLFFFFSLLTRGNQNNQVLFPHREREKIKKLRPNSNYLYANFTSVSTCGQSSRLAQQKLHKVLSGLWACMIFLSVSLRLLFVTSKFQAKRQAVLFIGIMPEHIRNCCWGVTWELP